MKDGGLDGLETGSPGAAAAAAAVAAAAAAVTTTPIPLKTMDPEASTETMTSRWNTKNLALRLGADALSAASAAALVAPIISIIDRSIMENASGRSPILTSLRTSFISLVRSPGSMLVSRPFRLIFALYGGTYLTANTLDTFISTTTTTTMTTATTTTPTTASPSSSSSSSSTSPTQQRDGPALPATHVSSGPAKFFASSAANIALCIYKDSVFVRLFGRGPARAVAAPSYLLFAARDCMTIFASFNVPPLLGPVLTRHLGDEVQRYASGQTVAQFAAPAAVQAFSTPVHLLGLDVYNRPGPVGWRDRLAAVGKNWGVSTAARVCRIVPAFGVGGVVNFKARTGMMEKLC